MNLRKHVAGFVIFSVIVGSAVFINVYLTAPIAVIPNVPVNAAPPQVQTAKTQPISYSVSQVLLDFNDGKSYIELQIRRPPVQPAPEKVWVTTYFFSPMYPGKLWTDKTEIRQPFAQSGQTYFIANASCSLCSFIDALPAQRVEPKNIESISGSFASPRSNTGFFARVYISTDYAVGIDTSNEHLDRDIRTAIPVVIQWPDRPPGIVY